MNAQLFKWSPDGWRKRIPPTHDRYRIRLNPVDDFTFSALITPISETDAVYQSDERDKPELLPETAEWKCEHMPVEVIRPAVPMVTEAVCRSCGAHGKLLTRADLERESA